MQDIDAHARALVASWPPLTPAQRETLGFLLGACAPRPSQPLGTQDAA